MKIKPTEKIFSAGFAPWREKDIAFKISVYSVVNKTRLRPPDLQHGPAQFHLSIRQVSPSLITILKNPCIPW
jgi:hypothetical protein